MNERTNPRYGEDAADDFFRADAEAKGYTSLRAYYRDFGMIQPEELRKEIPAREMTTAFPDLEDTRFVADIHGRQVSGSIGERHTKGTLQGWPEGRPFLPGRRPDPLR